MFPPCPRILVTYPIRSSAGAHGRKPNTSQRSDRVVTLGLERNGPFVLNGHPFLKTLEQEIPFYDCNGKYQGKAKAQRIAHLLKLHRISVVRSRHGKIVRANEISSETLKTAHCGQKYSYQENLQGARPWRHKPLPKGEADLFVRQIFRAVPLSVMS